MREPLAVRAKAPIAGSVAVLLGFVLTVAVSACASSEKAATTASPAAVAAAFVKAELSRHGVTEGTWCPRVKPTGSYIAVTHVPSGPVTATAVVLHRDGGSWTVRVRAREGGQLLARQTVSVRHGGGSYCIAKIID